ncbi:hypothetical protein [Thiorhodospira sibirica]|uniref:hypothetical protein n=1 Tax=Thiorhodospira sibirica TaxID=154347 RepID=UPI000304705C|nr:hypothetical protein [Thiorhodospira sibirica]
MMTTDSNVKEFIEEIKLRVFDDQFIDREEERELLQIAIQKGLGVDKGLAFIRQVAAEKGIVVEREANDRVKEILERFAANDGVVDKKEFEDALALYKSATKGKIPDPEMKRRLKQLMVDQGWKAKEGGLFGSKWFSAIS